MCTLIETESKDHYNIVGLIPFRSGSKRVPGKPLKLLNGVPLVQYTIDQAINSELEQVYITSDYSEEELKEHLELYNCKVIQRPKELCEDNSHYTAYIDHFLETQNITNIHALCLLQPTCPLRRVEDINQACEHFIISDNPTLVSVYKVSRNLLYDESNRSIFNPEYDPNYYVYVRNSSIYIFDIEYYKLSHNIFSKKPTTYEMPAGLSFDINTLKDFDIVKSMMIKGG